MMSPRVGPGSGPSRGRVGLGHKIFSLGLGRVQLSKVCYKCAIFLQETDYSLAIIPNDKKL